MPIVSIVTNIWVGLDFICTKQIMGVFSVAALSYMYVQYVHAEQAYLRHPSTRHMDIACALCHRTVLDLCGNTCSR